MPFDNEQFKRVFFDGVCKDIVLYYENWFLYKAIAEQAEIISTLDEKYFYILSQANALNAMHIHCCKIYESQHPKFRKKNFVEIINILKKSKQQVPIYNSLACKKFIEGTYKFSTDWALENDDKPIIDRDLVLNFCKRLEKQLPNKKKNRPLWNKLHPIERVRSKEIAHSDLELVTTRSTFESLGMLTGHAVELANVISQVFFGVVNMTGDRKPSLIESGKKASNALIQLLAN